MISTEEAIFSLAKHFNDDNNIFQTYLHVICKIKMPTKDDDEDEANNSSLSYTVTTTPES